MSSEISFNVGGRPFFVLVIAVPSIEERAYFDISIDTLSDLVAIESITRQALKPLTGTYSGTERAQLRRARLLWEGHVVPFRASPLPSVTTPAGTVPQVIVMPATTFSIAQIEVPSPNTCIRHPLMTAESVTAVPDSDPRWTG